MCSPPVWRSSTARPTDDRLDWVVGVYAFEENNVIDLDVPIFRGATAQDCAVWPVWCAPSPIPGIPTLGVFALIVQGSSRNQTMDGTNSSQAIFGEVTWQIADAWSLTAGARYSRDKREFERHQTLIGGALQPGLSCREGAGPLRNGKTRFDDVSFTEVTPRAILSWDVADNVMLYFGWSKGYSSGGFTLPSLKRLLARTNMDQQRAATARQIKGQGRHYSRFPAALVNENNRLNDHDRSKSNEIR